MVPHDGRVRYWSKPLFFEWIGYEIYSPDVLAFHESTARTRIMSAPARTSKSYSCAAEMAFDALPPWVMGKDGKPLFLESRLLWIVGPDYTTNKEFDYLWMWLVERRSELGLDYKIVRKAKQPKKGDLYIEIDWGRCIEGGRATTIIKGMSAERETALQGEEVYHAAMSEAAEQGSHILTKYLATRCHKLTLPTTPKPHAKWIRDLIDAGEKDPALSIAHFHYSIDFENRISPNPKFNWERFETAMRKAALNTESGKAEDDPYFAEQFLGLWVYYSGKVLPFRHAKGIPGRMSHVFTELPQSFDELRKFVSVDYGYDHRAVALFWAIMPDGTVMVFDEVVRRQLDPTSFVDTVRKRMADWRVVIDYFVGDPSRPEVADIMRERGMPVWDRGNKNAIRDRAAGTLRLIDYMADDPILGRPKLFVHERCVETIGEFKVLHRKEDYKQGDEFAKSSLAAKQNDDCYDAARYGIQTRPSPGVGGQRRDASWLDAITVPTRGNYWQPDSDVGMDYDGPVISWGSAA